MDINQKNTFTLIRWIEWSETVLVISLLTALVICVLLYQSGVEDRKRNIHSDVAGEVLAGRAIITQRTLFPKWYHGSEPQTFLTRPTLLYTLFGWLIGDMRRGFLIGLNVSLIIVIASYLFVMNIVGVHWRSALLGVIPLFLVPSSTTSNFWYAYAVYAAGMMLTLGVYIRLYRLPKGVKPSIVDCVGAIFLLGFAFVGGMTGLRLLLLLYLPLLLMTFQQAYHQRNTLLPWKLFPYIAGRWVLLLVVCSFLGQVTKKELIAHQLLLGGNWSPIFCSISDMLRHLPMVPVYLYSLLGIPNRSLHPLSNYGVALMISLILSLTIYWAWRNRHRFSTSGRHAMVWVGLSFVSSIFFGTWSTLPASNRYFFIFLFLASFATTLVHDYWYRTGREFPRFCLIALWLLMVVTISMPAATPALRAWRTGVRVPIQARVVEEFMKRHGVSRAYATYDNSIINTFFSNGRVDVAPLRHIVNQKDTRPRPYHYLTTPMSFTTGFLERNVMVFLSEKEEAAVRKDHSDFFSESIALGAVGDVQSTGWSPGSPIRAFLFPNHNPFTGDGPFARP